MDGRGLHPRFVFVCLVVWFQRRVERCLPDVADLSPVSPCLGCGTICSTQSTWQRHMGHFRHDDLAAGILESGDETQLTLESSDLVPGDPETVRGPQA